MKTILILFIGIIISISSTAQKEKSYHINTRDSILGIVQGTLLFNLTLQIYTNEVPYKAIKKEYGKRNNITIFTMDDVEMLISDAILYRATYIYTYEYEYKNLFKEKIDSARNFKGSPELIEFMQKNNSIKDYSELFARIILMEVRHDILQVKTIIKEFEIVRNKNYKESDSYNDFQKRMKKSYQAKENEFLNRDIDGTMKVPLFRYIRTNDAVIKDFPLPLIQPKKDHDENLLEQYSFYSSQCWPKYFKSIQPKKLDVPLNSELQYKRIFKKYN